MKPLALRKILVATDLSADVLPALETARKLAELSGAELHVIHANEDGADSSAVDRSAAEWIEHAGGGLLVRLVSGPAAPTITQEAARIEADVIVLGRHRNRIIKPGSTADRVVRTAHVPCLILPDELNFPIDTVLVPVDVTEAARGELTVALTWASALRRRASGRADFTSHIHVLHIRSDQDDRENERLRERLDNEVCEIRDRLGHIAGVEIEQHIEFADAIAPTILANAETRKADLIVLGTRGKRMADDPLGSVSSAVVKVASIPILLVPPEVWRSEADQELITA
jgi:nucleotide-binding universal stress UspA family protein